MIFQKFYIRDEFALKRAVFTQALKEFFDDQWYYLLFWIIYASCFMLLKLWFFATAGFLAVFDFNVFGFFGVAEFDSLIAFYFDWALTFGLADFTFGLPAFFTDSAMFPTANII